MNDFLHMENTSVLTEGRRLDSCVWTPNQMTAPGPGILFIHGLASSRSGYSRRAEATSMALARVSLTFNLSGHGDDARSFDRYSVYDHLEDTISAYDYLSSRAGVDQTRIGVCGASYGGYLAALLTAHRPVKRLILRAPSLARDVRFPSPKSQGVTELATPAGFDSLAALKGYDGDVLVIESEKDEIIPRSHIEAYLRACSRAEQRTILGATHALTHSDWDSEFVQYVITWFRRL